MIFDCNYFNPQTIGENNAATTQFASSSCELQNSTASITSVENGFSHGEIIISFFSFFIFITLAYAVIFFALRGIKIKQ